MIVKGFKFSGISSGIKGDGKKDLGLIFSDQPASIAGVFTKNVVKAAPVIISMERIKRGYARAVIVNSGCANACTGEEGIRRAERLTEAVAHYLNIKKEEVMVASTGLIGKQLPLEKIEMALPELVSKLDESSFRDFAEAIMTTDTFAKLSNYTIPTGDGEIHLLGIAKGAGMIRPHMATMLAFIVTDASASGHELQRMLKRAVKRSFNRISVDGDMSTNDTVMLLAGGGAGVRIDGKKKGVFEEYLQRICDDLSRMIVRDGEGATKFIVIHVKGGRSEGEARRIAEAIGNSILVKTAFFGESPNWGRIIAAAGAAGVGFDPERVDLYLNGIAVLKDGLQAGEDFKGGLNKKEIIVELDIKRGPFEFKYYTCDISHAYITINAHYHT